MSITQGFWTGQAVKVGSGKVVWRIIGWAFYRDVQHAELERIDRADVHTTVNVERLRKVHA